MNIFRFSILLTGILFFTCISLSGQRFTDIQAQLTGVSESASNWIDYNEDGALDIFVTGDFYRDQSQGISTKLYKNLRNDKFQSVYIPVVNVYRGDFDWGDYNNDGIDDLFIIGETTNGKLISYLYSNNRTSNFSLVPTDIQGYRDGSVEWGDYDGDGDLDLLLTGYTVGGPKTTIFRNDRKNRFKDIKAGIAGIDYGVGKWADFDNDGDLDVIIGGTESSGRVITHLYRNDNGAFNPLNNGFTGLKLSDIACGDYDNDGDMDFAIVGESQNGSFESRVYKNEGNGFFTQAFLGFIPVRSGSVDWGDMDHDGDLDMLITGESAVGPITKVYRNDRDDVFTDIQAEIIGLYLSDGHWGDYDNDGDLDVLVSGMSHDYRFIARVYRNDPIHTDTVINRKSDDIWFNTVVIPEPVRRIYYYVFASCYCDLYDNGEQKYHVFFSPVRKQTVQYEMQRKFNKLVREQFPNWYDFDQANIIENGFTTIAKAQESKNIAIREYESNGFIVHQIMW